ncbi:MAG: hypothetical protein BGO90_14975 [Legionella sp. 40-6]|nr:FecR domain-containing protein [Legionella sp.]OJY39459.1 MAG: hypothetical protein BGO90_14975 [Legionella sp. 40-6]
MKKLITICLLLGMSSAFAASVAKVLYTASKVVASHNGVSRALTRGSTLDAGDTIITSSNAAANIQYQNGTLVNLGENTNYKILGYTPNQDTAIKAELNAGKLQLKTPGKVKETLRTPVMALAILGTQVSVYVPQKDKVYVSVQEGRVEAGGAIFGAGKSFLITPQGIVETPFPAAGQINTPKSAEGTIAAQSSNQTTTSSGTSAQADSSNVSATNTIATVAQVTDSAQMVGSTVSATNASTAVINNTVETLAVLSVVCL